MVQANYQQNNQTQSDELEVQEETNNSGSPFNIHAELDDLEEMILSGSGIPFTELAILNIDLLVDQLNLIKVNLPIELTTAVEIVNRRQEIIGEAKGYACLVVKSAEDKAQRMLQESAIVRQAELDGAKLRLKTEQECELLTQTTKAEVAQWRQNAIAECMAIQTDADNYTDSALGDIEQRLRQMLCIVQNGRQQVAQASPE